MNRNSLLRIIVIGLSSAFCYSGSLIAQDFQCDILFTPSHDPQLAQTRTFAGYSTSLDGEDANDEMGAPPGMVYYAYFYQDEWPRYYWIDSRQWLSPYQDTKTWTVKLASATGITTTLTWDPGLLPSISGGHFTLNHVSGGPIDMSNVGTATVTGDSVLTIEYTWTPSQYTLTMAVNPVDGGTTEPAIGDHTYNAGEVVGISASTSTGYEFVNWDGDVADPNNPNTSVTMNADKTVTANFQLKEFTLTVNIVGNGSVSKNPDQVTYHYNDVVQLTALPDTGWSFTGWSGGLYGMNNPEYITITGDMAVTATFTQDEYTLTVNIDGNGSVIKEPNQDTYHYNDVVQLTAVPDTGWSFVTWSGDLSGTTNIENITITGNMEVTATFAQDEYTLTVNIDGNGSVTKDPDQDTYHYNDVVQLTATPDPGWKFVDWSGDVTGTNTTENITITGDMAVTATFTEEEYTLTVNIVGNGSVTKEPDQATYHYNDVVQLTAFPDPDCLFAGWSGDFSGTNNPDSVTISGNMTITVTFLVPPKIYFCATSTMGCPPLEVRFTDNSEGDPSAWSWDFGDGETSTEQNPTYTYWKPGEHHVTLTITTSGGTFTHAKEYFIIVYGYGPISWSPLQLVDNSPAHPSENWDNAIDDDISCLDGTVTAGGEDNDAWAIFQFLDGSTCSINKVRMLCDTHIGWENRWMKKFRVQVSTTGIEDSDFNTVVNGIKQENGWEEFPFDPVSAKYIRLVIDEPDNGWRQLGEFQVCPVRQYASAVNSAISASSPHIANGIDFATVIIKVNDANGNPISTLGDEDFCIYATGFENIYYPIEESSTSGTYTTMLAALDEGNRIIHVSANGIAIGQATVNFTFPDLITADLRLVEGVGGLSGEDWDNAIDGDTDGFDGTVTAGGEMPYGIFEFANSSVAAVNRLRMLVDTGVGYPERWVQHFRLQVSTTGTNDADFGTILDGAKSGSDWQEFRFPAANAKYIKLILTHPTSGLRQLGEIEVDITDPLTVKHADTKYDNLVSVAGIPHTFMVYKNYPNPFNPETLIKFTLPEKNHVRIEIFNVFGQKIRTLIDADVNAGYHSIVWNGKNDLKVPASSGTYFFRVSTENDVRYVKTLLIR